MLNGILADIESRIQAKYFIADRYYGNIKLIRYMEEEKNIKCVIPIRDTIHKRVKDRFEKEFYKKIYKDRNAVERFIGNVKNKFGDRDRTRILEIAQKYIMARFILWNMILYMKVKFFVCFMVMGWMVFQMVYLYRF